MYPFWNEVVAPVIEAAGARRIVEVGALRGENTELMLERLGPDVELHVIDPLPDFDPAEHEQRFEGRYIFHRDLSVNVLGDLPPMDVALIDGDHNWYTVRNEMRLLAKVARAAGAPLPVSILHDVGWPYGRRDLYYDPATIPDRHRQPWRRAGIRRGQSELLPGGAGLNAQLANAVHEGGPRNGVLTAVEDFVADHGRPVRLVVLPIYFGLAILVEEARLADNPALTAVLDRLESPSGRDMLLRLGEDIRLDAAVTEQLLLDKHTRHVDLLTGRYLDTVKSAIVNDHHVEVEARSQYLIEFARRGSGFNEAVLADPARRHDPGLVRRIEEHHRRGGEGADTAEAMARQSYAANGRLGLDHLHRYLDLVWGAKVAGDFAVCGVGPGGSALLMAAFLEAHDGARPGRQRKLWVLDRFRRSPHGVELNLFRDRLNRFDLLGPRVRLLQGDPEATAGDVAAEQLAVLHLGPGVGDDVAQVLEHLYPRLAPGGVVLVEAGPPALPEAVEAYRCRKGVTAPLERDESRGLAWIKEEPLGEPGTVAPAPRPTGSPGSTLTVRPSSPPRPGTSVPASRAT